jgi:hypothetical protein
MSLEAATYIHELDSANPTGADPRAQGDDHTRLVKSTLQNTFSAVEGEVTASHTELNYLDGATGVTGTGHTVRSIAPALTGTATAETLNASGELQVDGTSVLKMVNGTGGTYTASADDTGKIVDCTGNITLGNVATGTTIVLMNTSAGSLTVTATHGTLKYWAGAGNAVATGARGLRRDGVCTVHKDAAGDWRIFGAGVT